jgi:hypothetical protein
MAKLNNRKLKIRFLFFNRKFFKGKLSKHTIVRFASTKQERRHLGAYLGMTSLAGRHILLNTKYQHSRRITLSTLLYEMVHAKTWRKNSDCNSVRWNDFNRESLRIAKLGAFNGLW